MRDRFPFLPLPVMVSHASDLSGEIRTLALLRLLYWLRERGWGQRKRERERVCGGRGRGGGGGEVRVCV